MKLYTISAPPSTTKHGFAWCSGIQWVEGKMDYLTPGPLTDLEQRFAAVNKDRAPGLHIDSGGTRWPDFLGSGGGMPPFYVSDHVIRSLRKANISIRRAIEIPIGSISGDKLKAIPAPTYFVLEAEIGIDADLVVVPKASEGVTTRYRNSAYWAGDVSSWNGLHLFTRQRPNGTPQDYTWLFCTERVIQLSEEDGWTNFTTEEIVLF